MKHLVVVKLAGLATCLLGYTAASTYGQSISAHAVIEKTISLSLAIDLAQAAMTECRRRGFSVTVVVVDASGNLKVLLHEDGSVPVSTESARRKALTAMNFKMPTAALAQMAKGGGMEALLALPDTLMAPGGIPIKVADAVIGAIGVGGASAPGGDEACALAAVAMLSDGSK